MPLRMLRYVVGVWNEYVKLHPATRMLPPVIPCVLYHGPAPWKSPTDVASMVDVDDATRALLGPLIPSMHFLLDDLSARDPEQLTARESSAAVRLVLHALQRFATTHDPVGEILRLHDLNYQVEILTKDFGHLSTKSTGLRDAIQAVRIVVAFAKESRSHVVVRAAESPWRLAHDEAVRRLFPVDVVSCVRSDEPGSATISCLTTDDSELAGAAAAAATLARSWGWDETPTILVRFESTARTFQVDPQFQAGAWTATVVEM